MNIEGSIQPIQPFRDSRGWVGEFFDDEEFTIRNIHGGTMKPGAIRGNHVHERADERIIFYESPVRIILKNDDEIEEFETDRPVMVINQSGQAHAFQNISESEVRFVAYTNLPFETNRETTEEDRLIDPEPD